MIEKLHVPAIVVVMVLAMLIAACTAAPTTAAGDMYLSSTSAEAAVNNIQSADEMRTKRDIPFPSHPTRPQPSTSTDGSCESENTNSSVPTAHIKGHGIERGKWIHSTAESGAVTPGYQQRWRCNDVYGDNRYRGREQAFVDGGVWFNQTDKSIYVPKCGYYIVYSQVLFVIHHSPLLEAKTVYHNLKIRHNCIWQHDSGPIQLQAKASIAPYDSGNPDGGIATTHTATVVHLCDGGQVWIEIPDGENGVPCCPRGDESGTFLGLFLLASTPCSSWPPTITMTRKY